LRTLDDGAVVSAHNLSSLLLPLLQPPHIAA
jgi:hypothetical protein